MKKTKLLMPLTGIAAIGAIAPVVAMTSCSKNKTISAADLDISSDGKVLNGLKDGAKIDGCTTLAIPETVEEISAFAFYDAESNGSLLANVETLVLNAKCNKFGSYCFYGAGFTTLDFSNYTVDSTFFRDGEFGLMSFGGFQHEKGTIKFNSEWDLYKKQHIKSALYAAGLYSNDWYDVVEVKTKNDLREAANIGGHIKLMADIDVTAGETELLEYGIEFRKNCILDLNGHSITASDIVWSEETKAFSVISVWDEAQVVIDDTSTAKTGKIVAPEFKTADQDSTYCIMVRTDTPERRSPSLTVVNGKFYGNSSCIHTYRGYTFIEGGEFHMNDSFIAKKDTTADATPYKFMLNCQDTPYKKEEANFYVYGGKFYGKNTEFTSGTVTVHEYDPSKSASESPVANFVLEGYKSVGHNVDASATAGDNYYEVVEDAE